MAGKSRGAVGCVRTWFSRKVGTHSASPIVLSQVATWYARAATQKGMR